MRLRTHSWILAAIEFQLFRRRTAGVVGIGEVDGFENHLSCNGTFWEHATSTVIEMSEGNALVADFSDEA